ncbi:hypothetical protein IWW36_001314 [Coemansia brasiliensis]|uniref:AAA-ATPase-like domain-containing protein n=1 Tax=Coemansia brasiliensis TaxID=2650707 RepID=A0A9W8M0Y3_9FUNG|nr:hypothetical protein IWW36_001314 [Coemansia brasiliensis]
MSTEDYPRNNIRSSSDKGAPVDWSPTKIHGSNVEYADFKCGVNYDRLFVDKTLICKAFFDIKESVVCVSAPARFGKTTNTDILEKFFHILTFDDMKESGPFFNYREPPGPFDLETARANRAKLFEQTLLHESQPSFFSEHFCRYPVIYINFMVTRYDSEKPEYFYKRLLFNMLTSVQHWTNMLNCSGFNDKQKEQYEALKAMNASVSADLKKSFDNWQNYKNSPKALFACLSDFVASLSSERYIIIIESCDMPFIELQGKPWEQGMRPILLELFTQMLKDNDRLLKALLLGTYAIPLNYLGLDSLNIIPAFNGCSQQQVEYPLTNEQAIASMFGFTASEIYAIAGRMNLNEQDKQLLNYYGGYNFGFKDARFNCAQVISCLTKIKKHPNDQLDTAQSNPIQKYKDNLNMLRLPISKAHDIVKSITRKPSPELLMLVLRLISDYDNGTSSCFFWSTAELKAERCQHADDSLSNFSLDLLAYLGNTTAESSLDAIMTLFVCLGYLTIGGNNALRIPSGCMRDMWESLRLLATFGTAVQVQQDAQQHRLIGSLYNSEVDLLCHEFTSALQQISADGQNYSQQVQLEFICRSLLSKLSTMRYTFEHRLANLKYDAQFLLDPQFDKPWSFTLLPFGRYIQILTVTLCFKRSSSLAASEEQTKIDVASSHHNSNAQHHLQLNLVVVIDKDNAAVLKSSE